jgi:hypothetical protein
MLVLAPVSILIAGAIAEHSRLYSDNGSTYGWVTSEGLLVIYVLSTKVVG